MKTYTDKYIVNPDESVTFLQDYTYAHGGSAKKGETLTPTEIIEREILFYYKSPMKTWGYNSK